MGSSAGTIPFCSWMGDHHCGIPSFKEWWLWAHPTQPRGKLSRSPQVCSWMGDPPDHPHLNGWWWCPPLMPPPREAQEGLSSSILRWGTPKPSVFEWWRCSPPSVAPWGAQQGLPCFVPGWGVILSSLWGIPIFLGGGGVFPILFWRISIPSGEGSLVGQTSIYSGVLQYSPTSQSRFCPI